MAEKMLGPGGQPIPPAKENPNVLLKERLEILYEYEKKYLELTKNYKDEIKLVAGLQEDIRKERTKFFRDDLKDVHKTLDDLKVEEQVTNLWITELVNSYTKSLDISADLAKDRILEMLGLLRESAQKDLNGLSPVS